MDGGTPFGRYRLLVLLGRGGMGEVWRAFDTATHRIVAIKLLPPHLAHDNTFMQRFHREALAAARLNNAHVIPIHNYGEVDGRLYVDMRLIEGRDLQSVIASGPLKPDMAVRIIEQVAQALDAAHEAGLVHRDVKPSNILLDNEDFAYLIDFGIARGVDETGLTTTGGVIGSWHYMAPERMGGARQIDPRCDTYALTCVLYECLTGTRPFPGDSLESQVAAHLTAPPPQPSIANPDVPTQFDAVITTGMAKEPEGRYATAGGLARAARDALTTRNQLGGTSAGDRVPTPTAPKSPTPWRRRKAVMLAITATLTTLAITVTVVMAIDRHDRSVTSHSKDLDSTIDPQVQKAAWNAMAEGCGGGPCNGAVVALDPSTGKILAMISAQSPNQELLVSHDVRAWERLSGNPYDPQVNRAIVETYPPGSTFMVITAAAALQAGATDHEQLTAAPTIPLPDSTAIVRNYGGTPCGTEPTVELRDAFARSCNAAFAQLGLLSGADAFRSTAQAFGFDSPPGPIPLQVRESTVGPIPDAAALGMSSIGQKDVALTPLQNAMVAAAIANKGVLMQPYLVDGLQNPGLGELSITQPHQLRRAVSAGVAATLTDLMVGAEQLAPEEGAMPGVQIASKTGIAEYGSDPANTPPHAWYIAFAPAQQPKVAIAVLIENGGDRGDTLAAPIGRAIISATLRGRS